MALFAILTFISAPARVREIHLRRLSSTQSELPVPGTSREQTGDVAARLDPDSPATDFVLSFRVVGPALLWYRRNPKGWDRYLIEKEFLPIEAGGTAFDVDGDGDLDVIFGSDSQGNKLWWWENPYPNFDPNIPWKRHVIKDSGANQHHDMIFADVEGLGKPQLIFWNQGAKTVFLAEIPKDPRHTEPWSFKPIFSGQAGEGLRGAALYAEGMDAYDVDGDGRMDLLAGNYWFKYEGGGVFKPIKIGTIGGRIKAGKFKPGKYPQIVIAPGDGSGPLKIYECNGDPTDPNSWTGRSLLDRDMVHGHTLDIGDIDGDGNLDILAGEQGKWTTLPNELDNPKAATWVLFGDGKGNFRTTVLATGEGSHDGKIADFDGDGDMDLLQKPYAWSAPRVDVWLNNGTGRVRQWKARNAPSVRPASFRQPVGMELWTYRRELNKDLPGTLATIHRLGFTDVETASFYGRTPADFRAILDEAGLTCSSIIAGYERLKEDLDGVARDAKALGASYVLTSGIPHKGELTAGDVQRAVADFNEWGKRLKERGLQFGYHPHGFEFVHTPRSTLFDVIAAETNPEYVTFEMDAFWFVHGGADPVAYLQRYPNRFQLIHLKDMAKGAKRDLSGQAPDETSVALGLGQLDWASILGAARVAGIKHYFIEDESPDAARQVPASRAFLRALRY